MRALCIGLAIAFAAGPAVAKKKKKKKGSCTSAAEVTSDVWKYSGPIVTKTLSAAGPHGATAAQIMKATDKGIQAWNKLVGKQSWATIGPRRLDFNKWARGRVVGATERVFISSIPAFKKVELDFHKLDGKGEIRVVVCKKAKGKKFGAKQVAAFTVGPRTKKGKVRTVTIKGAKEHVIKVVLHGKKLLKGVQYKVRARM